MVRQSKLFNFGQVVQGSFRGIKFFIQNDSGKDTGKNVAIHRYPNSSKVFIEDLGQLKDSFSFVCWVKNLRSFNDRDVLETALLKEGAGEFIHPFWGSKNVIAISHNIINEYGRSIFTIDFKETDNAVLPIQTDKNKGFVNFVKNTLKSLQESKFGQGLQIVKKGINVFQKEVEKVNDGLDLILRSANSVVNTTNELADLQNEVFDVFNNINVLVKTPSDLATRFTTIFNNMEVIGASNADTYNALKDLFGFGSDDEELINESTSNTIINENNRITNNLIRVNALSIAYTTSLNIKYENNEQLENVRNTIENEYQDLFGQLDEDTSNELKSLRANANAVFDDLEQNIPKIFIENFLNPESLHQIVYNYYGNFTNSDDFEIQFNKILNLNPQITNYEFVEGEVKLLTNE